MWIPAQSHGEEVGRLGSRPSSTQRLGPPCSLQQALSLPAENLPAKHGQEQHLCIVGI